MNHHFDAHYFLRRCCLLSIHGYAVPGIGADETSQVSYQLGTRIYTELQDITGSIQEDER